MHRTPRQDTLHIHRLLPSVQCSQIPETKDAVLLGQGMFLTGSIYIAPINRFARAAGIAARSCFPQTNICTTARD